jgi:hypothetical protein
MRASQRKGMGGTLITWMLVLLLARCAAGQGDAGRTVSEETAVLPDLKADTVVIVLDSPLCWISGKLRKSDHTRIGCY